MPARPWFAFFPGDYLADTAHLSLEEHGAYLKLICHAWNHDGTVPSDPRQLGHIWGCHTNRAKNLWGVLAQFFYETGGKFRHKRIDKEITKAIERKGKASRAAEGRWNASSNAQAMPPISTTTEEKRNPPSEGKEKRSPTRPRARPRGTRLDPTWELPEDWREWARKHGNGLDLDLEADKFRDYWTAKSGNQATKVNWQATWRNWIRTALERHGQKPNGTIGLTYGKLKAMSSSELLGWATQLSVPTRGKSQYDLIADVLSAYQEQHA